MHVSYLLLAFIEGLTEFLPISSTAHLILASKTLTIDLTDSYVKFYLLFIQLGALCAGGLLFGKRILTDRQMMRNLLASFVPTAILGFVFYKAFKHLLEGNLLFMAIVLALGGVVFIYLEKIFIPMQLQKKEVKNVMSLSDAVIIGVAQVLAIVPGVSRSGITIIAGVLLGLKKTVIVEYTFLLALPTLGAAVMYDAYKSRDMLLALASYNEVMLGFAMATAVGVLTLLLLRKYLPRMSLAAFGWYRIALAVVIIMMM